MNGVIRKARKLSGIGIIALASTQAFASGFKLEMQSSSVLADSGDAAVVEDAGTNWYNSAGLVYLPQQLVASAIDVYANTTFRGTSSAPNIYFPTLAGLYGPTIAAALAPGFTGTGKSASNTNTVLPAFHYNFPFLDRYAFGISVVPAWGLAENYGKTGITRYDLAQISTKTLDVAPSLAMKINNQWSVGAGPDFHYFEVTSSNMSRTTNLTGSPLFPGAGGDSYVRSTANNWNMGGHVGALYRLSDATRFGVNYRSKIVMNMSGQSDYSFYGGGPNLESSNFKLKMVMPPTTSISAYHDINPRWAVMGTVAFDQWSVFRNFSARNYILPNGGLLNVVQPQDMRNTIDYGAGFHYTFNEMWMFRGNVKYEPTPTVNKYRDINFPDADKLGFQIGARCHVSKKVALDMLYGHVFLKKATINFTNAITGVVTTGRVNTSMDLVGAQVVWDI